MSYTMEDFKFDYFKEHFPKLRLEDQRKALERLPVEQRRELYLSLLIEQRRELPQSLPAEERLSGLSPEQIRQYLEQMAADRPATPRKPKRKR